MVNDYKLQHGSTIYVARAHIQEAKSRDTVYCLYWVQRMVVPLDDHVVEGQGGCTSYSMNNFDN